jgi:hypothetical protein
LPSPTTLFSDRTFAFKVALNQRFVGGCGGPKLATARAQMRASTRES